MTVLRGNSRGSAAWATSEEPRARRERRTPLLCMRVHLRVHRPETDTQGPR